MNVYNIANAFEEKKKRGWDKIFWAFDLHQTIIEGKYNKYNVGAELYPGAQEVLQNLYARKDMVLILWTCSYPSAVKDILDRLKYTYGIQFHYVNENLECPSTELCDFSRKFYFNILIEDKSGAEGPTCWREIKDELIRISEWKILQDDKYTSNITNEQLAKYEKKDDQANVDALKARLNIMKDQTD